MKVKQEELEFEWDEGNKDKSRLKHGITPEEAELVFQDEDLLIIPDVPHSLTEERLIAIGKSGEGRVLFIVFTTRRGKVRVISARRMHRKEVDKYAKIKKSTQI